MSPPVNNNHIPPRANSLVKPNSVPPKKAPSRGHLGSRSVVPPAMRFAASMNTTNLANLRSAPRSGANYQDDNLMKLVETRLDKASAMLPGKGSGINFSSSGGVSSGSIAADKMCAVLSILSWIESALALGNMQCSDEAAKGKALEQAALMHAEAVNAIVMGAVQFSISAASAAVSCSTAIGSAVGEAGKAAEAASQAATKATSAVSKASEAAAEATKAAENASKVAANAVNIAKDTASKAAEAANKAADAVKVADKAAEAAKKATEAAKAAKGMEDAAKAMGATNAPQLAQDSAKAATEAAKAVENAKVAKTAVDTTRAAADTAKKVAENAKKAADSAVAAADSLQKAANTAKTAESAAKTKADAAKTKADAAKADAEKLANDPKEIEKAAKAEKLVANRAAAATKTLDTLSGAVGTADKALAAHNREQQAILTADIQSLKLVSDAAKKIYNEDLPKLLAAIMKSMEDYRQAEVSMMKSISRA